VDLLVYLESECSVWIDWESSWWIHFCLIWWRRSYHY